jgi:hypothetical protein
MLGERVLQGYSGSVARVSSVSPGEGDREGGHDSQNSYGEPCGFGTPSYVMYAMYLSTGTSKSWKLMDMICTMLANNTFTEIGIWELYRSSKHNNVKANE